MRFFLVLSLFLLLLPPSWAKTPKCTRVFITGLNLDAVSKDKVGIEKIALELFTEIKRRVGCTYDEKNLSFTRATEDLRLRRIDLYAFAFVIPEFEEIADAKVLYSVQRILLVQKSLFKEGLSAEDYLKDPHIKFGAISGGMFFTSNDEIDRLQKEKRIVFDPFPDGLLRLFAQGKIQALFISPTYLNIYSEKYSLKEIAGIVADSKTLDLALFFSKSRMPPSEQARFRSAIEGMQQDGSIRKILLRFIPQEEVEKYYTF